MANYKLAELLLRRKELNEQVERLKAIRVEHLYETVVDRKKVTESLDEVVARVAKVTYNEIEAAYNHYAKQLRQVDAAIQQANWTTEVAVDFDPMKDYEAPKEK